MLDRKTRGRTRNTIKDKAQRERFMMEASAMLRLAALFDHDDMPDHADEARLYSQLAASGSNQP